MAKKQPTNKYKYDLVEVIWDDAETDNGWEETPVDLKEALAITVGFLVKETAKHLLIANSYDSANNHTNGRIQIPKSMVKTMSILKLQRKPKIEVNSDSGQEIQL